METSAVRAGAEGAGVLVPQPTAAFDLALLLWGMEFKSFVSLCTLPGKRLPALTDAGLPAPAACADG